MEDIQVNKPKIHGVSDDMLFTRRTRITPLGMASFQGYLPIVNLLLKMKDIQVNTQQEIPYPLFYACQNGHSEIVKSLLKMKGIRFNQLVMGQYTPLWFACLGGYLEIVRSLLAMNGILINQMANGETPLKISISDASVEIVRLLIGYYTDYKVVNHYYKYASEWCEFYLNGLRDLCHDPDVNNRQKRTDIFLILQNKLAELRPEPQAPVLLQGLRSTSVTVNEALEQEETEETKETKETVPFTWHSTGLSEEQVEEIPSALATVHEQSSIDQWHEDPIHVVHAPTFGGKRKTRSKGQKHRKHKKRKKYKTRKVRKK